MNSGYWKDADLLNMNTLHNNTFYIDISANLIKYK